MPLNRGSRMTFYCRTFITHQTLVILTKSIRDLVPNSEKEIERARSNTRNLTLYVTTSHFGFVFIVMIRCYVCFLSFRWISISFLTKAKSVHCDSIVCWTDTGSTSFWWKLRKSKKCDLNGMCALYFAHEIGTMRFFFRMFVCFSFYHMHGMKSTVIFSDYTLTHSI